MLQIVKLTQILYHTSHQIATYNRIFFRIFYKIVKYSKALTLILVILTVESLQMSTASTKNAPI